MTINQIFAEAEKLINQLISETMINKGHYLTGASQEALSHKDVKQGDSDVMEGFTLHYIEFVNSGTRPEKASMRQWYFVRNYFMQRGLSEKEAGGAAAATIRTWMKTGMSTPASARFSKDGTRNRVIDDAFINNNDEINNYFSKSFDDALEIEYRKEKSEII